MVVVLIKMVGKDPFIQENANAVQQKITPKAKDEVIEAYYDTAVNHFTRLFKEWMKLHREMEGKDEHYEEPTKQDEEKNNIGKAVSKFISKKVWHFSEVNY